MLFVVLTLLLANTYVGIIKGWPWESLLGVPLCFVGIGLVIFMKLNEPPESQKFLFRRK